MKFGEKVKYLREKQNITQKELANAVDLSLRTIASYENSGVYPRTQDVYEKLANALSCDANYLKVEEPEVDYLCSTPEGSFIIEAKSSYGNRGKYQAEQIVQQTAALFAGGDLSDEDKTAFMREISSIFFDSKERAKKFTPKKYKNNKEDNLQ